MCIDVYQSGQKLTASACGILLNAATVMYAALSAEDVSKIAFNSSKKAGLHLSCSITVVNGAALLITGPVIAK